MDKESADTLDKFTAPLGRQEIELLEVRYLAGGMPLLRVRIREKSRFTIFEIDALTAARWGRGMIDWADRQER
jgi:hypothetical protein